MGSVGHPIQIDMFILSHTKELSAPFLSNIKYYTRKLITMQELICRKKQEQEFIQFAAHFSFSQPFQETDRALNKVFHKNQLF